MTETTESNATSDVAGLHDRVIMHNVVSDDYVNSLFAGANFGEPVNSSVAAKRMQIAKTLRNQLDGYWSGSTAYDIAVRGGFLVDAKSGEQKRLTALGVAYMAEFGGA